MELLIRGCNTLLFRRICPHSNQLRGAGNGRKDLTMNTCLSGIRRIRLRAKPFEQYYIKDELEVDLDSLLEKAFDHKKAITNE
jgi:hypothetical protein